MAGKEATSRGAIALSLFALYVIWGSTYFAMRVSLEGFPPFLMAGLRHVTAGTMLLGFLCIQGAPWPTRREWKGALVTGGLLLTGGNGAVAFAERTVASSFAAMVVASTPLWVALIGLVYGLRPTRRETVGLVIGFVGVVVLNVGQPIGGDPLAFAAILAAPVLWAWGTVLSKRMVLPKGARSSAAQMIAGGFLLVVFGGSIGERIDHIPATRPVLAVLYLVVFGSIAAFSAYGYLVQNARPAVATSYAYVNPIIAIALGVLFAHEDFTVRAGVAIAFTLGGVLLLTRRATPVVAPPDESANQPSS